jgi:hypothetical protein
VTTDGRRVTLAEQWRQYADRPPAARRIARASLVAGAILGALIIAATAAVLAAVVVVAYRWITN